MPIRRRNLLNMLCSHQTIKKSKLVVGYHIDHIFHHEQCFNTTLHMVLQPSKAMKRVVGQKPIDPSPVPAQINISNSSSSQHSDSKSAPAQPNDPILHPPENESNDGNEEFYSLSSFTGPE